MPLKMVKNLRMKMISAEYAASLSRVVAQVVKCPAMIVL
jgi:hypothetical protein